ncbi:MAG: hypothetical protein PHN59_01025 [Candidatus Omnitrophica bacterium]|nr:hypothetical protein [Candidatus Omnitrophota bacterium]
MKKNRIAFTIVFILAFDWTGLFAGELEWGDVGAQNRDIRAVLINPYNPALKFCAAKNQVLATMDNGKNWKKVLSVKGENNLINFLSFYPLNNNNLYAATQAGLYYSNNQGNSWQKIFRGKNYLENDCTTLKILPDCLYLGTKAGLFLSRDNGRKWEKASGKLRQARVVSIAAVLKEPNIIYAACVEGIFQSKDAGNSWERIFVAKKSQEAAKEEAEDSQLEEAEKSSELKFLTLDPVNPDYLYLAADSGIYQSQDKGRAWEKLSDYGLLDKEAIYIYISKESRLFILTKSGLFEYLAGRWHELSFGLHFKEIRVITEDNRGNLYLACDSGLFKSQENFNHNALAIIEKNEQYPSIRQVQEAAIKYAEVEPKKIICWRKQAAKRALFPRVSASVNRDAGDLWHWESGSSTKSGDDVLIKGRDSIGWDVTLTWDLAEVIWSDAQTSIDTRSRLMVQLREDVLDEVTKIYYERIRLRREINNLPLEDGVKRAEKSLRLEELSAYLDGLTGGYFSLHNPQ